MKLYTEEQMHSAMLLALGRHGIYIPNKHYQDLIDLLNPIELPSDEEINEVAMIVYDFDARDIKDVLEYKAFKRGAKYVINKIQGGNNGNTNSN